MPRIAMTVPHALGQEEAVRRLKEAFQNVTRTYKDQVNELSEQWVDSVLNYRFNTMGIAVSGTVAAQPAEVHVVAVLPLMAVMFKGTIEKRLQEELTKLLG